VRHRATPANWVLKATTAVEHERAARMASSSARTRFLTGRALAKVTLASVLEQPLAERWIDRTCRYCGDATHGKPTVTDAPWLRWSLSRADDVSAVAWSRDVEVGLDIVATSSVLPHFTPVTWTSVEAALKLCGRGLVEDPRLVLLAPGTAQVPGQPLATLTPALIPSTVGMVATPESVTLVVREVDEISGVLF